jgi:hypothetical protein
MTPEAALDSQIQKYSAMTGEQRLALAFEMHELSCELAREQIRDQFPQADAPEVERRLHQRLKLAHAI